MTEENNKIKMPKESGLYSFSNDHTLKLLAESNALSFDDPKILKESLEQLYIERPELKARHDSGNDKLVIIVPDIKFATKHAHSLIAERAFLCPIPILAINTPQITPESFEPLSDSVVHAGIDNAIHKILLKAKESNDESLVIRDNLLPNSLGSFPINKDHFILNLPDSHITKSTKEHGWYRQFDKPSKRKNLKR
jgi:hypothetical protein